MSGLIDTHSHIYQPDFENDINEVIQRAKQAGIVKILMPNIDVESIVRLNKLAGNYPACCFPMMGLHPTSVTKNWKTDLQIIKEQFSKRHYIAVGEIGIDLYWDKSLEKEQIIVFEEQLKWSIEYDLPVVIHSRDAIYECVDSVRKIGEGKLRGVFHSFGGNPEELKAILTLENFFVGINGVVTFKNSSLANTLKETDLSRIILETDSPYLAPVPYRGKRNEPAYVKIVAEKISEIYSVPVKDVISLTTENTKKLFQLI